MGNSPQDAFSDFVVDHALKSMDNHTKVALSHGIQTGKGKIAMDKKNVKHALNIFLQNNSGLEGQIEITPILLKEITRRLSDVVLNEGSVLREARTVGLRNAIFTSGEVMNYA